MNICFQKSFQRAFGTYPLTGEVLTAAILAAADVGYRAFDTAQMYGNEADTGAAIAATGLARNDICITTKVHPDNFTDRLFLPSVAQSLKHLRVTQVDLLLLHWPPIGGDIAPSLRLLEAARREGLTMNIGVSNYTVQMMRDATRIIEAPIATNQVEFHPLINQDKLLAAAVETGIPLSAFSSVARGEVFKHKIFADIGKGYGKSAGQVVLRWILQKGVSLNTMSTNPTNIAANFEIMDFTLSSIDMARIDAMKAINFRLIGKDLVPWAPDWD